MCKKNQEKNKRKSKKNPKKTKTKKRFFPTPPQGAGREGAGATARSAREEHQSRQGGGGSVINVPPGSVSVLPLLRIRVRIQNRISEKSLKFDTV
jgi:hypothetical protein